MNRGYLLLLCKSLNMIFKTFPNTILGANIAVLDLPKNALLLPEELCDIL